MLTTEQKHDLRQRVLAGQQLTPEESRAVVESLVGARRSAAEAARAASSKKPTKRRKVMTDGELDADLDAALGIKPAAGSGVDFAPDLDLS